MPPLFSWGFNMSSDGGSGSDSSRGDSGSGGGLGGGGYSGGGLSIGSRSGLGLRGDSGTSANTGGLGNTGLGGGRPAGDGSGGSSGGGLSIAGLYSKRPAQTSGTSAAVSDAISRVAATPPPSERSFFDYMKQGLNIAGGLIGIASGTPMGVLGGIASLGDMAAKTNFSGPSADGLGSSFGNTDKGGRNESFGNVGAIGSGLSGGGAFGGDSVRATNHLYSGTPLTGNKADGVPAGDAVRFAIPETSSATGEKALPAIQNVSEGAIVTTTKTDYAALIVPAILFLLFRA